LRVLRRIEGSDYDGFPRQWASQDGSSIFVHLGAIELRAGTERKSQKNPTQRFKGPAIPEYLFATMSKPSAQTSFCTCRQVGHAGLAVISQIIDAETV
jgi:hypothetical protein